MRGCFLVLIPEIKEHFSEYQETNTMTCIQWKPVFVWNFLCSREYGIKTSVSYNKREVFQSETKTPRI